MLFAKTGKILVIIFSNTFLSAFPFSSPSRTLNINVRFFFFHYSPQVLRLLFFFFSVYFRLSLTQIVIFLLVSMMRDFQLHSGHFDFYIGRLGILFHLLF